MHKYEIEFVQDRNWFSQALIMMLTGYSLAEVLKHTGKRRALPAKNFRAAFQALGYSCSDRFMPFDAQTIYPVLLRALGPQKPQRTAASGRVRQPPPDWYAFVYYDQKVYDPFHGITPLDRFAECYPELRISSMIQVWVSAGTESIASRPIK